MLKKALVKLKVKRGDFLMCHGNMSVSYIYNNNLRNSLKTFFDELINFIGKNGTLIVPAFTPSFIDKKIFNSRRDKSEVGSFSEYFRKLSITKRTFHPIFSFSVYGKLLNKILKCKIDDCFVKNTIFDFFLKKKGKILCCGTGFKHITFTIYVEQLNKVPHRYFKFFTGKINNKKPKKIRYYVRNLKMKTDLEYTLIKKEMIKKKKLNFCTINRIKFYSFKASDYLKIASRLLRSDTNALIEERFNNK